MVLVTSNALRSLIVKPNFRTKKVFVRRYYVRGQRIKVRKIDRKILFVRTYESTHLHQILSLLRLAMLGASYAYLHSLALHCKHLAKEQHVLSWAKS